MRCTASAKARMQCLPEQQSSMCKHLVGGTLIALLVAVKTDDTQGRKDLNSSSSITLIEKGTLMHIGFLIKDRMSPDYILSFIKDPSNLNICTDLVTFPWKEEPSYAALLFSSCKKNLLETIFFTRPSSTRAGL